MADTGAPWNLPYPLSTDLVRDGAQAIQDLAEATASGLNSAGNPGIGSNVVQTVKSDTFTTSSSTFTAITGLAATITPSSDDSKVLVIATVSAGSAGTSGLGALRLMRGATAIAVGDSAGSRTRASSDFMTPASTTTQSNVIAFLDTPGVDTATTYSVEAAFIGGSGNIFINRSSDDADGAFRARTVSSITVIEVAA